MPGQCSNIVDTRFQQYNRQVGHKVRFLTRYAHVRYMRELLEIIERHVFVFPL